MATDLIQAYQEALKQLETSTSQVERYVVEILNGASKLRHWESVVISNSGIGFPIEAHGESIDANNWPSAQQLAEVLSEWHKVYHAVNNAWNAIPKDRRVGIQPPPSR